MSLDDNLADLERHAADFASGRGFTYTVLAPNSASVVGCVYIYPGDDGSGASVRSWVREQDAELDRELYEAVIRWLAEAWPFERYSYAPR